MAHDMPHRRRNLLTGEWLLVSPHRAQRPWQGERSDPVVDARARHDAAICVPGTNARAGITIPIMPGASCSPMIFPP